VTLLADVVRVSAAVAAKSIIWVAVGLGLYLVPEAARRSESAVRLVFVDTSMPRAAA